MLLIVTVLLAAGVVFLAGYVFAQKMVIRQLQDEKFQTEDQLNYVIWGSTRVKNELLDYKQAFEDANTSLNLMLQEDLARDPVPQSREVTEHQNLERVLSSTKESV